MYHPSITLRLHDIQCFPKCTSLFFCRHKLRAKNVYEIDTCRWFHKHFKGITYDPSILRCTILPLHRGWMTYSVSQNALAYLSAAISYARKKFMKLTPGGGWQKLSGAGLRSPPAGSCSSPPWHGSGQAPGAKVIKSHLHLRFWSIGAQYLCGRATAGKNNLVKEKIFL